jgi:hypothetical protein
MAKRKITKAEREQLEVHHRRMEENIQRTRKLAEKALARFSAHRFGLDWYRLVWRLSDLE